MVSKKRRHTHKTSINNSLNNSRSKKPRRIYRGGTAEEEAAATAAALALTGSDTPIAPTPTPTDDTLQQEIVNLKNQCNDALEKTQAAALTAQQAAQAAEAANTAAQATKTAAADAAHVAADAAANAASDAAGAIFLPADAAAADAAAAARLTKAREIKKTTDEISDHVNVVFTEVESARSEAVQAASKAQAAFVAAKREYDKLVNSYTKEQIIPILIAIKQQLANAETERNKAIQKADKAKLINITPTFLTNKSYQISDYYDENKKNEAIEVKRPTISQQVGDDFNKAEHNIGYNASVKQYVGSTGPINTADRKNTDFTKTTNYRFRIYNWENPLVLPFYDDTQSKESIKIDNYFEMITTDRKTSELIVTPIGPNIEVHNRLLTIGLTDTMGKLQNYKIGRRRVFTKLSRDDEYSRQFYDEIIIRDANTGKQLIKQLKEANKHNTENTPYIDFKFNIKNLSSFTSRDVKAWDMNTAQQLLQEYFETKKADNDSVNIYTQYSDLNTQSNTRLMDLDDIKKIIGYLNKILEELNNPAFKFMIQQGNYGKFQSAANGSELIDQEIAKMRREFEGRRKYYRNELNLKRRDETFSASIKNVGSGSDPALSAKLDKLEKKVDQLKQEKDAGDARLDDRTGVMVYTMPPGSTIKRNARPQQSFDEQVMNFMKMIKGSQLTSANKGIIRLINETSKLYDSIEDEIIKADEIFLEMKGNPLGIDIKPVLTPEGTIVISNGAPNKLKAMNQVNINIQGNERDTLSRFLRDLDEIFKNLARDVDQIVANKKDILKKINTININFQSGGANINDLIPKESAQKRLENIETGLSGDIGKSKIDVLVEPYTELKDADLKTKIKYEYNANIDKIKKKYDEFKTNIEYMTLIINHRLKTPTSGGARKTRIRNRVRANTHSRKRHGIHKFKNRLYSGGAEPGESSTVDGNLASLQNKLDTENSPIPPPESNQEEEPKPDESEESKPDESEESKPDESEESKPDESEESKPDESEEPKPDDEESKPDESEESKEDEESKPEDEDKEDESKPEDEDKEDDKDEDKDDESKPEDEDKEDESKPEDEAEEELKPENESKEDEESGEQELGEDEDNPEEEKESEDKESEDKESEEAQDKEAEDKESEVNVTGMGSAIESMQGDLEQIDKSIDETQDSLTKAIELINDGQKDVKQGDLEEGNKKIDDGSQMLERIARQLENSKDDLKKSINDMDSNLLQQLDNRLGNIEEILGKVKAGEQVSEDDDSNETSVKKSTQKEDDDDIADNCVKICSQEDQDDYLNDQMSMMNPAIMQQGMNNPMMQQGMMMNPMMQQGMMMNPMMQQGMMMNPLMQQGMMMNPMMQQGMMMNPMAMNPMAMNPMAMNPMAMNPQFMYNNPYLYQNQPIMNPMMENPRNNNNMFNSTRSRQYRPPRDSKTRKNRDFTRQDKANDESPTIEESETE